MKEVEEQNARCTIQELCLLRRRMDPQHVITAQCNIPPRGMKTSVTFLYNGIQACQRDQFTVMFK